ncbi:MAG: efflux RND transporter periplasmic adaptor subunit [Gemmatimonadaceae bacterium]
MRTSRRFIGWSITMVVIGAVATAAMWPEREEVDVAEAALGTLTVTVGAESRTRARERFVVTAPVAGRLQRIRLRTGDAVRAGEVVARVSPLPLDAASVEAVRSRVAAALATQRDAQARLRQAREAMLLAQRDLERVRAVEAAGGVSRQQLEQVGLLAINRTEDVAAAESRERAAAAELWAARAALPFHGEQGYATSVSVLAPASGRVLNVPHESERVVPAGTPLLELGRDADLEVIADVLSEDAVRIPVDASVELAGWGGDVILRGQVRRIEPAAQTRVSALGVDEQRVQVVIAPLETPRRLGDGYRLEARITIWEGRDVLAIPPSALFTANGESRVFVVEDGRARLRTVRVGRRSDSAVQILEGIVEGDLVVLFPSDRIRSGTRVRPSLIAAAKTRGY